MRWFVATAPADDMKAVIRCTWNATAEGRHDLVPDGCVELLWIAGRGLWICGPDTTGWAFELPPGTATTGVRLRPGAGAAVLGLAAPALVDRRERLGAVASERIETSLDDQVSAAGDGRARRRALEEFVRRRAHDAAAEPMIVAAALLGRAQHPIGTLARVADEFGVSSRHFRRRFADAVGYSPAYYARIARIQRFLRLAAGRRGARLAELTAAAGYTDQAHLSRDCSDIAGMTPRRLVANIEHTSAEVTPPDVRSVQDDDGATARRSSS
jgi:AraC-like DNA-binding protein